MENAFCKTSIICSLTSQKFKSKPKAAIKQTGLYGETFVYIVNDTQQ